MNFHLISDTYVNFDNIDFVHVKTETKKTTRIFVQIDDSYYERRYKGPSETGCAYFDRNGNHVCSTPSVVFSSMQDYATEATGDLKLLAQLEAKAEKGEVIERTISSHTVSILFYQGATCINTMSTTISDVLDDDLLITVADQKTLYDETKASIDNILRQQPTIIEEL